MTNRYLYRSIDGDDQHYSRIFRLLNKLRFILVAILFLVFIILLGILIFRENFTEKFNKENESSGLIIAKNGAVATEVANCSQFGVDVLKEGGNAVDAAITSMICVGTINSFSAGIGGGGFMLIRLPNGSAEVIDFREVAPIKSHEYMLNSNNKPGLTIGVPGEIAGMKLAHERYGKLPWKRLFMPSINISRNGFPVPAELSIRLMLYKDIVLNNPMLSSIYAPNDGKLLKEGEILYRTNYSITLEKIANNYTEFYKGSIAKLLIKTIQDAGGIMILEDLANYYPVVRKPIIGYYNGRKIITTPEPASGTVLIFLLNLLERYELHKSALTGINLHRMVEALKFGFARRTEMGDPEFFENTSEHSLRMLELISKEYADIVQKNLTDDKTHNPNYYNPLYSEVNDHGTAHLSVIDKDDMAVSFTSSVNRIWGSQVIDSNTGIILNDQMYDFSLPGEPDIFGMPPSPFNFIKPGKKPLSSTIPTVIEKDGKLELVIGGSGGTRIISAVLQVIINALDFDMNLLLAVNNPRLHQQLFPEHAFIESGFSFKLIENLLEIGHVILMSNIHDRRFSAMVQAVRKFNNNTIHVASDFRKFGKAAGY